MDSDVERVLFTSEQLQTRINELAKVISEDYKHSNNLLLVGILKGSYMFLADLSRALHLCGCPHFIDFMSVSSYQNTSSTGSIKIKADISQSLSNKDVIIVEDIIDEGRTLHYLVDLFKTRGPKSLQVCTLFSKTSMRKFEVTVKYIGYEIENLFIIGFGLDFNEYFRNLPYVGILSTSAFDKYSSS